ncbi:UNVERIFIED_CONTAM: hypothetical protein HDU68_005900 [Siphonaria sp. JEL0065]|nr:hypothetical protein HDU68_005900 [Siphonaria sp. JEL0065]
MTQYTVVAGDTHYEIAKRHGLTLEQFYALNPGLQNHVYDMQIGTVVNVGGQSQYSPPQTPPNVYGGAPQYQPPHHQPPQQQQQQQQQGQGNIWNSTGMHVAEGVLGTAAVVGLGAFAVHQWRENKRHNAHSNAPAFTQYQSSRGPLFWRSVIPGTPVPQDAIQLGRDVDNAPIFAARAPFAGGWHIGKINGSSQTCYISYGGREETIKQGFEVLCGSPNTISVVPQSGHLNLQGLTQQPLDAGHEENGDRLFVAIVEHQGSVQVGKCGPATEGINFGFGGKEVNSRNYKVVVIV